MARQIIADGGAWGVQQLPEALYGEGCKSGERKQWEKGRMLRLPKVWNQFLVPFLCAPLRGTPVTTRLGSAGWAGRARRDASLAQRHRLRALGARMRAL